VSVTSSEEMMDKNLKYNSFFADNRGYIPQKHFTKLDKDEEL
jgi:hypothetical protein